MLGDFPADCPHRTHCHYRHGSSAGCSEFPAYSQVLLRQHQSTLGPFLLLRLENTCIFERAGHFCRPLMVAHESGLSHPETALGLRAWRIVSEDSIHSVASLPTAVHPFPESKNLVVVTVAQAIG